MSLLGTFKKNKAVRDALFESQGATSKSVVSNLDGVALLLFSLALADDLKGPIVSVFPGEDRMNLFEQEISWLLESHGMADRWEILLLPDYEVYEIINSPNAVRDRRRRRLHTLRALYMDDNRKRKWVLSTPAGIARKTMTPAVFRELTLAVAEGDAVSMADIEDSLFKAGYQRRKNVEKEGDFAVRGGMIDIFPSQDETPVRVEMAGNRVDEIREFNPETQRSSRRIGKVVACPCSEAAVSTLKGDISVLRKDYRELVERGIYFDGSILYPDLFGSTANPVLDGWLSEMLVFNEELCVRERERERREAIAWLAKNEYDHPELLYDNIYAEIKESDVRKIALEPSAGGGGRRLPVSMLPPLPLNLTAIAERIRKEESRGPVYIISKYRSRLERFLEEENIMSAVTIEGDLRGGFSLGDADMFVFTDSEMFHRAPAQKTKKPKKRSKDRVPIAAPEDIRKGDYVVHSDHGIGMFDGIVKQSLGEGVSKDFFRIKYARDDVLFVPVDQIDRIEKYIGGSSSLPKIYPLHSGRWAKVKQKVRKKVEEMAAELYRLYQERANVPGYQFSGDNIFMNELSESFPYEETDDQVLTIEEVLADMQKPSPMDRLVYGDVGYGKTEVALRAAFKATLDKKQVALLAPTTILAHQHFKTFSERLARFPVTIDVISRFRSRKEQNLTLKNLATGELDIIIGTHRLLSKDIVFRDLGLLIVDEEQRFGVKHKETLKMMTRNVDVLTLTATPIPRTLNMSMIGLRDMSLIETAPHERKAVRTFVEEWNTASLYVAIERELARGGQVYFVHNDIETIEKIRAFLQNSFEKARIAVCHGKMPETQIEQTMIEFDNNEYDILVSTTIIENGLDIPNVNTLIVNSAENFGLAQLYQLRGRVGRSYRQSYAYIFHSPWDHLNRQARERLEAIRDFDDLGSGYRLAMKDLEIRGAGNLLGREQHGFVTEVGFNLYCQMLSESVDRFKGLKVEARPVVEVDLQVDSFIPESYVDDQLKRAAFYKKITGAQELEKIDVIVDEMQDRYGEAPVPFKNFIAQSKIRLLAPALGVEKIKTHPRSQLTDIIFRSETAFSKFRRLPFPRGLTIEVVDLKDRVRLIHENMKPRRVVSEILEYIIFAADEYEKETGQDD